MLGQEKKRYSIKSVENALKILEALGDEDGEVSISTLSHKLGMHKSYVFRMLATFENRGYVERAKKSGSYRVGLSAYETGQKMLSRMDLLRKAKPVMEILVRECNESLYLAVSTGKDILMLDMVDTTQQVRINSLIGKRYPLASSAAGEVFLSYGAEPEGRGARLKETEGKEPDAVRKRGFSADVGRLGEGVASLAVPLLNARNRVPGILCFVGPQFRFTEEKIRRDLLPRLKSAALTISAQLGYLERCMFR